MSTVGQMVLDHMAIVLRGPGGMSSEELVVHRAWGSSKRKTPVGQSRPEFVSCEVLLSEGGVRRTRRLPHRRPRRHHQSRRRHHHQSRRSRYCRCQHY